MNVKLQRDEERGAIVGCRNPMARSAQTTDVAKYGIIGALF